jgi:hypothetical protein
VRRTWMVVVVGLVLYVGDDVRRIKPLLSPNKRTEPEHQHAESIAEWYRVLIPAR